MHPENSRASERPCIAMEQGDLRCEVVPALGGAISGLWFRETPILRSGPAAQLQSPRQGGCFALLPFSNRIGHGKLHWRDTTYSLQPTPADAPHAIHGVGWQRAWAVSHVDANGIEMVYVHQPDGSWPFPFTATQSVRLQDHRIFLSVSYCNTHDEPVPVGLGWHPYFAKRAGARMSFCSEGRWDVGNDKLPIARTESMGMECDAHDAEVDNCFDGWNGVAEISDSQLIIRMTSDANYLVAYTKPDLEFLALEPVSHVSNALQLATALDCDAAKLGMNSLTPGGTMRHQVTIEVASSQSHVS